MSRIKIEGAGLLAIIRDTTTDHHGEVRDKNDEELTRLHAELKDLKKKVGEEIPQGVEKELIISTLKARAKEFDDDENLLDAFHLYRRVLRLDPDDVEALYQLATMYYSIEMREKAIECLYAILEIDPAHKPAAESLEELKNEY